MKLYTLAQLHLLTRQKLQGIVLELEDELALADKTIGELRRNGLKQQDIHIKAMDEALKHQRKKHGELYNAAMAELDIQRSAKLRAEAKVKEQAREIEALKREQARLDNIASRVLAKEIKAEFAPKRLAKAANE